MVVPTGAQGLHEPAAGTEGCMSMNLLRLFSGRDASAPVARERLQILLAHERGLLGQPDLLVMLREEILAVVVEARPARSGQGHGQAGPRQDRSRRWRSTSRCPNYFGQDRSRPPRGAWPAGGGTSIDIDMRPGATTISSAGRGRESLNFR